MPPKKNVKKAKAPAVDNKKGRKGARPKPKPTAIDNKKTTIDNRKISNKPQTQSVNVSVNVGGKGTDKTATDSNKQMVARKKFNAFTSSAPTIIPQYVQGNPLPFPPQPPNRVVQSNYESIKPAPIMTSLGSLDATSMSSTPIGVSSVGGVRSSSNAPSLSSLSDLDDDLRSVASISGRRSYAISEPISELSEESYKYSSDEQTPSGINLQSVGSIGTGMMVPISRTEFTNMPYNITQEDSFDDVAKLVKESISKSLLERMSRPRPPLREIIYDDGSIQVISQEQQPLMLEMSMADQPAPIEMDEEEYKQMSVSERVQEIENRKRGRKPGTKNRPKEELEADKQEKLMKKKEREEKRMEIAEREMRREEERQKKEEERRRRIEGNRNFINVRHDEIDRRIEKKAGL